ncbi:MAG: NAD-binding protein, partial [bacterium]|nr:NAD-binding protein [bacterium]
RQAAEGRDRARPAARRTRPTLRRPDPILTSIVSIALVFFVLASAFYDEELRISPLEALYLVVGRVTSNTDISLWHHTPLVEIVTIVVMLAGIGFAGTLIALLTNYLVSRREELVAGLRRIRARGHVVVCGSGVVGSRVVEYLLALGASVVIVERNPDPALVAQARERGASIITGDATREQTLEYAGAATALGVVALAADDTTNLKIALTARALRNDLHVVLRFNNASLGRAVERRLRAGAVHALHDLAAPLVAERVARRDVLDRVRIHGTAFTVVRCGDQALPPFCCARDGRPHVYRSGERPVEGDVVLALIDSRSEEREAGRSR